jgi:hypothetical protein
MSTWERGDAELVGEGRGHRLVAGEGHGCDASAVSPTARGGEESTGEWTEEADVYRFFLQASTHLYFFPTVLAQNRCNFSRLTGLPNSDFHLRPKKNWACNLQGFSVDYRASKHAISV